MSQLTDEEVAIMVQKGDIQSFGLIVERYEQKIMRYARNFYITMRMLRISYRKFLLRLTRTYKVLIMGDKLKDSSIKIKAGASAIKIHSPQNKCVIGLFCYFFYFTALYEYKDKLTGFAVYRKDKN